MHKRCLIVGDVHGCLEELQELLDEVSFQPGVDRLVSVGDLVHKGPDSAGVVRFMREAGAELTLGNHEGQQNRFRKALVACKGDIDKIKMKDKEALHALEQALSPEDVAYLESARLFVPVPGGMVVHAGVLPIHMQTLPTDAEIAVMSKGEREKLERVTRVRYIRGAPDVRITVEFRVDHDLSLEEGEELQPVDLGGLVEENATMVVTKKVVKEAGEFLSLGSEGPTDPFWAARYNRAQFGHIYFGHHPFIGHRKPSRFPHATGLDLGCVFGGRLCCMILDEDPHFITVEAQKKYADSLWDE